MVRSFFLEAKNLDRLRFQLLRPERLPSPPRIHGLDQQAEVFTEILACVRRSDFGLGRQPLSWTGWRPSGSR